MQQGFVGTTNGFVLTSGNNNRGQPISPPKRRNSCGNLANQPTPALPLPKVDPQTSLCSAASWGKPPSGSGACKQGVRAKQGGEGRRGGGKARQDSTQAEATKRRQLGTATNTCRKKWERVLNTTWWLFKARGQKSQPTNGTTPQNQHERMGHWLGHRSAT